MKKEVEMGCPAFASGLNQDNYDKIAKVDLGSFCSLELVLMYGERTGSAGNRSSRQS